MINNTTTATPTGAREVDLLSTGNEKLRFTVVLFCIADGAELHPYIVFKCKTLPKAVNFLGNVVCVNDKGLMNEDLVVG